MHREDEIMIKVLFANGKLGEVEYTRIGKFIYTQRVVAYKIFDVWIEARRKNKGPYQGPERRVSTLC